MKIKRLKSWPHWKRSNAGLFVAGLALYAVGYSLLCWLGHPRIVFMALTLVAVLFWIFLLWIIIQRKDKNET